MEEWRGLRHYWGLINGQEMFLCVASTGKSYSRVEKTTKIVDNKVFGAGGEKMLNEEEKRKVGKQKEREGQSLTGGDVAYVRILGLFHVPR